MKTIKNIIIGVGLSLLFTSCNETESNTPFVNELSQESNTEVDNNVSDFIDSSSEENTTESDDDFLTVDNNAVVKKISLKKEFTEVPVLVVIMNWDNYRETDESLWHDKIFNKQTNSLNRWYSEFSTIDGESYLNLVPASETYGIANDGVIVVEMHKNHPGDSDLEFRDIEISNAITSDTVVNNVDFASFDKDGNGVISFTELQILFVVAGGEVSYGDSPRDSIWAHSWNYEERNAPVVDGVTLMKSSSDMSELGYYLRMGATHDIDGRRPHKATVGIIAHEMGHSLLGQWDLYDISGYGSGLGFYDIMSGGAWALKPEDFYAGETPTQFSAYSVLDSFYAKDTLDVENPNSITLKCSSGEFLKLETSKENEYFLLECRDSARVVSDKSFVSADSSFTDNKLFAVFYHVDTQKSDNSESGLQTETHHYMVSVVERNSATLMTSNAWIYADYIDVYTDGTEIFTNRTALYDGRNTGYSVEVLSSDYTDRTMTFAIRK
jgi:M6 family metalloprotease-like protein